MHEQNSTEQINALFKTANRMARSYQPIGLDDRDDLVQQTMLKVLDRNGNVPTEGWLFKVMRNTAIDAGRRVMRERRYIYPQRSDAGLRVAEQSDEYVYARYCQHHDAQPEIDLMPRIKNMLANLGKSARQVLVLYAEGYSYEEISQFTCVPIGTVRSRLHYARRRAKDILFDLA